MIAIIFGSGLLSGVVALTPFTRERVKSRISSGDSDAVPKQHLQILGLYDSGTSLLHSTLEANFPGLFELRGSADFDGLGPGIWKHANLDALVHFEPGHARQHREQHVIGVAMVRNPLSWLQALRKAPYDFEDCVQGRRWLTHRCALPDSAPRHQAAWLGERLVFPSIPGIWSNWTESYQHLRDYGFDRSVVIRYEDLVTDPGAVLASIAEIAGVPLPSTVVIQKEPAKDTGEPHGRQEALRLIKTKAHLANYSQPDLRLACAQIDRRLARRLEYFDCSAAFPEDDLTMF